MLLIAPGIAPLLSAAADPAPRKAPGATPSDLNAIAGWIHFKSAPDSLYRHLAGEAYDLLAQRNARVRSIGSPAAWRSHQEALAHTLGDMVGPWPARSPLNARIVRTIEKADYRIEHIVFESQPGFHVSSSLFLPRQLTTKAPVILYCSGHSDTGYRGGYTRTILNLVRKGFVVFAWDPIGQGERLQYVNRSGKSAVGVGTREHAYMTVQAMLTGSSLTRHVIWDGMRAIDYLETRAEVDITRIGATGRSGGGFQSLYIPAFDPRIYATAPENHVTNSTRILQKIGPRDGEQNLYHMFARGIDHADLLAIRAPKPTLVVATANDIFNIDGTRETVREVALVYRALGASDHLQLIEDIAGHQSTTQNNETIYAFFQKHLRHPGSPGTEEVELPSDAEMRVTETGQVRSAFGGETVASLTRREADRLVARLAAEAKAGRMTPRDIVEAARRHSGFRTPSSTDRPVLTGSAQRDGYVVERYFLKGEGDYPIPFVSMVPAQPNGKAILYLHPDGKAAEGGKGQEIEWLVRQGYTVLAPDLVGTGEAGPGDSSAERDFFHRPNTGVSYRTWYAAMFIGRSIVGLRAADVVRLSAVLKDNGAREILGIARGRLGPVLLHAAAFTDSLARIALVDAPVSYHALATTEMYAPQFIEAFVPGALQSYDLPYLATSLASKGVVLHNSVDAEGRRLTADAATAAHAEPRGAYRQAGTSDPLQVTHGDDIRAMLARFLQN